MNICSTVTKKRLVYDLKASNIMLDKNYNASLGYLGSTYAVENEKTSYEQYKVQWDTSYMGPECFHVGRATREPNVF